MDEPLIVSHDDWIRWYYTHSLPVMKRRIQHVERVAEHFTHFRVFEYSPALSPASVPRGFRVFTEEELMQISKGLGLTFALYSIYVEPTLTSAGRGFPFMIRTGRF